jgi:uncharacterized protein (TIGR02996 family)
MSEEQALLRAICEDPDDDTVRLVYADWLEERGEPDEVARAEFIRVQVALTGAADQDPARPGLLVREYLDLYHNTIGARGVRALDESPYLRRLTNLNLVGAKVGRAGLRALARSPNLAHLLELDLGDNTIDEAGAEALAASTCLGPHTTLWVEGSGHAEMVLRGRFGEQVNFR